MANERFEILENATYDAIKEAYEKKMNENGKHKLNNIQLLPTRERMETTSSTNNITYDSPNDIASPSASPNIVYSVPPNIRNDE